MGRLRSDSDAHIKAQSVWPSEERDTLSTCPVCGGTKVKAVEGPLPGEYKTFPCRWCSGLGSVTKKLQLAFIRWLRIRNHNRLRGRCKT